VICYRFRPGKVQEVIHQVLKSNLADKTYNSEEALIWTQTISDEIKAAIKELGLDRYKIVVQTVIGEQRGEGVKMACRCLWDSDTDNYAQDVFINESLFCVAAAYGIYFY
jgi:tctex1 domain-containing protein 2